MGIITIVTLVSAGAGVYMLSKAIPNFQPGNKKIQADFLALKTEIEKLNLDLVPVSQEELELFSFDQVHQQKSKGVAPTQRGVFTSIYHEPVMAYAYKEYLGSGKNGIVYARTAKHEFYYRYKKKEVSLTIDNQNVGVIRDNGILYSNKTKRPLARLNREQADLMPVLVNDREVASLTKKIKQNPKAKNLSIRAFEFVKNDISKQETYLLLALTLLEYLEQNEV
jgi:hypothetical protein